MTSIVLLELIHIVSVVVGVGSATVSNHYFLHAIRDGRLHHAEFEFFKRTSWLTLGCITLLVVSGFWLLLAGDIPPDHRYFAKITVVAILALNGVMFHGFGMPLIWERVGRVFSKKLSYVSMWLLASSSAVSIISWYSALILGVFRNMTVPYLVFVVTYIVTIFLASLVGHLVLSGAFPGQRRSMLSREME